MPDKKGFSEEIQPIDLDGRMGDVVYNALQHDRYQAKIKEMIIQHSKTVEFEELVMKYAGKEYDNRILKSGRFWFTTILTTIITSVISATIAFLIARG